MKHGQLALLAFLAVTWLLDCRPSPAAGTAIDPAAAEAALRQADADWAAAAGTASVEAWMVFYTADAIVLLPKGQLASGKELVRQSITRLLAQPHLAVAWHPLKVEMARSGDLAFVSSSYDLRFSDARGMPVSDRGRRIEIWRKQVDGPWKCIVDTWNSDEPVAAAPAALPTAPTAASPTSAQGTSPTAVTPAPPAPPAPSMPMEPPRPARAPEPEPLTPASTVATKYGDMPSDYKEAITRYFQDHLKNPESIQYREITKPEQGYVTSIVGSFLMREQRVYGWKVKATINATNSHDKYVGFKTYTFLFRGEKIVNALSPLPQDEVN
jgi:ketosteroid isomerase-like protein